MPDFQFRFPLVKPGWIRCNILLSASVFVSKVSTHVFLKRCSYLSSTRNTYSYSLANILSLFGPLFTGPNLFYYICWKKCISQHKKLHRKNFVFPRSLSFVNNQPVCNHCPQSLTTEQAALNSDFMGSVGVCNITDHLDCVSLGLIYTDRASLLYICNRFGGQARLFSCNKLTDMKTFTNCQFICKLSLLFQKRGLYLSLHLGFHRLLKRQD